MPDSSQEQEPAFLRLGLSPDQIASFTSGQIVVFEFPTGDSKGIAVIAQSDNRLRLGIVSVNAVGVGIASMVALRQRAETLALSLRCNEIELLGVEVINQRLEDILIRRGFVEVEIECPEELGNETVTALSKIERIAEAHA